MTGAFCQGIWGSVSIKIDAYCERNPNVEPSRISYSLLPSSLCHPCYLYVGRPPAKLWRGRPLKTNHMPYDIAIHKSSQRLYKSARVMCSHGRSSRALLVSCRQSVAYCWLCRLLQLLISSVSRSKHSHYNKKKKERNYYARVAPPFHACAPSMCRGLSFLHPSQID
jgi:hypothetical protein